MNGLAERLGIRFPLIQAGMGGIAGPRLAAAVASAGAGGVVALYRMRAASIRGTVARTRELTACPFGVNLIPELMDVAGLSDQVSAVLDATDASVFFVFYDVPDTTIARMLVRAGRAWLVMVGCVEQATVAEARGATAVVLQGCEAGGHLLGTRRLGELVAAMPGGGGIPFLGAGGIASGEHFARIHRMGAAGCVCGTLFVATHESEAHADYKQRLVEARAADTVVTDVFETGWRNRRHRVLGNALTAPGAARRASAFIAETTIDGTRFPIPRYSAMVPTERTHGSIAEMAMYCGESVDGIHSIDSARARVERFIAEFEAGARAGRDVGAEARWTHEST